MLNTGRGHDEEFEFVICSACRNGFTKVRSDPRWRYCPYCGLENGNIEHTMDEFMYGQDMGDPEDGRL